MSACSFSILKLNLVLTHGIPPEFRGSVRLFLPAPHTIGSVPSLSSHAIAYRLRSLPRVRWRRASSPQGSSSNGCCLCITTDQMLLCSSLFQNPLDHWYTVSMFKLSGVYQNISTAVVYCCTVLWNCFLPPTYGLYTCEEFSANGKISSYVVFQNIVIIAALPRVRWHRASSPQGSSSNGCCLRITLDQMLLCSTLLPHPLLVYSEYTREYIKILVLL